jgi:hypothetical protein
VDKIAKDASVSPRTIKNDAAFALTVDQIEEKQRYMETLGAKNPPYSSMAVGGISPKGRFSSGG